MKLQIRRQAQYLASASVIYPDFPLYLTVFFGEAIISIFGDQEAGILGFQTLHKKYL